ncbi:MAG: hypothetical protein AAGA54_17990 [Myxococcota bacterium]
MPQSRVYTTHSAEDALGLLEDGIGSVVIVVGDGTTSAGRACLRALSEVADEYDPDHVMFAHVEPRHLPCHARLHDEIESEVESQLGRRTTLEGSFPEHRGQPFVLSCRDGEVLDASVGRHCSVRLRRQVDRLLRDDPGPSLLTRLFRFASGA